MILEYYKDYICVPDGEKTSITISKKALEEWRDHYRNVAKKHPDEREFTKLYYVGMADVLTDILKHFEEE